jgi:uncharacterized protein YaaN involved in tellurite resistance
MVDQLTPPEQLEPPEAIEPVSSERAEEMLPVSVKPDTETLAEIDDRVAMFVDALANADVHSEVFETRLAAIHSLGNKEIREAADVSNRLLDRPIRALGDDSEVSQALLSLRSTVEELDPSDEAGQQRKLLGIIPLGDRATQYFRKYKSAQEQIDAILNSLYHGQDELRRDIAAIEQEKANLWEIMGRLQEVIHAVRQLDRGIEVRLAEIEAEDPEKARVVREEILFYVRQKEQDLLTQLAVSVQGYMALDVIRRNDLELIKGVERATTTTISALRTAIIVAQALTNQKLVLDQITALNTTTSNLVSGTSAMLKSQSAEIHEQASASTVSLEHLQTAFNNVFETLDMISNYKTAALDSMAQTISLLSSEVGKATEYLDRVRSDQAIEAAGDLLALEDEGSDAGS